MKEDSLKRLAEAMLQISFPSAFKYKVVTKSKSRYLIACYLPNDFKITLNHLLKVKKLDEQIKSVWIESCATEPRKFLCCCLIESVTSFVPHGVKRQRLADSITGE